MNAVTFRGIPYTLSGTQPETGRSAPDFALVNDELADVSLADFSQNHLLLSVVPSIDTPVCAASAREFETMAKKYGDSCGFITLSRDTPFAQARFREKEGLVYTTLLSDMRRGSFAEDFGVLIADGPLSGLCARAVFLLGPEENGKRELLYREIVPEIAWEPDYRSAMAILDSAG